MIKPYLSYILLPGWVTNITKSSHWPIFYLINILKVSYLCNSLNQQWKVILIGVKEEYISNILKGRKAVYSPENHMHILQGLLNAITKVQTMTLFVWYCTQNLIALAATFSFKLDWLSLHQLKLQITGIWQWNYESICISCGSVTALLVLRQEAVGSSPTPDITVQNLCQHSREVPSYTHQVTDGQISYQC